MKQFDFPSSSSPKVYHTLIQDNGLLSCDCPGWVVKKLNKARECKHTRKVAAGEGLTLQERDGQMFVVDSTNNPARLPPSVLTTPSQAKPTTQSNSGVIQPLLASVMPEGKNADAFDSDWVMEEKYDGHRLIIRVEEDKADVDAGTTDAMKLVTAWSRLGNTRTLPKHIHELMLDMPVGVYDGELIVPSSQHSYSVTAGQNSGLEALVLFDMLEVDGKSIMQTEQHVRRAFLQIAIDALDVQGMAVFIAAQHRPSLAKVQEIWERGGEGAIIKKQSAKYSPGWRTADWIKVKAVANATLTIIGFVAGKNGPYSVVKLRDKDGVETTVKTLDNQTMRLFEKYPTNFIGKRLVISYQEKMPSGKYRHPHWDHFAGVGE